MAEFRSIYEQYGRPVYRFLLKLTGDQNDAEELLSETFYRAYISIDKFEGRCSVYTWLCGIGKNAWLSECRRRKRTVPVYAPDVGSPEQSVVEREQYRIVREAIAALSEPYRDVLITHLYGEVPLKEIAAQYGKSESWARVTYLRARKKITEELL